MAQKLSPPVKKSSAKAKAKGPRKVRPRQAAPGKRGDKGCPAHEEGYGETDEARRKDYPPLEKAGGEENGA